MSKILRIISATVAIFATVALSAKDGKSERSYGPFVASGAANNWFISVGGGADCIMDGVLSGSFNGKVTPTFDFSFGKWVTPTIGGRLAYNGVMDSIDGHANFWDHYVHGDVLWNITNQFRGYKEKRVYNFIPYGHVGAYVGDTKRYNIAGGVGLLNNFRLHKYVTLFVDLRATATYGSQFFGDGLAGVVSATGGLTFNMGKKVTFEKAAEDCSDALAAAEAALAEALAGKKAAEDSLEALRNRPQEVREIVTERVVGGPMVLYFDRGISELTVLEQQHMIHYLQNIDKDGTFTITGSADSATGTREINERLCQERVECVVALLHEAGVTDEQIVIKDYVIEELPEHPEMARSVIIER